MLTKQTGNVRPRIVYNFISDSDSIGELHVFFHGSGMPVEGEKIYLESEFTEGIFLPKGKYRHQTEGQLRMIRDNLKMQHWVVIKINQNDPNIQRINLVTTDDEII